MSELAADVLVSLSTPDEVDCRLGVLTVTDGTPSANRIGTVCDRLDVMRGRDGRAAAAMMTGQTGAGNVGGGPRVSARSSSDPGPVQTLEERI